MNLGLVGRLEVSRVQDTGPCTTVLETHTSDEPFYKEQDGVKSVIAGPPSLNPFPDGPKMG